MLLGGASLVKAERCCEGASIGSSGRMGLRIAAGGLHPPALRFREAARWIIPSGILALLHKCPACIAAYVAIGGGLGISMSTSTYLRTGLIVLCLASLAAHAVSRGRHVLARWTESPNKRNT
jgi:hypothetical protein